MCVTDASCFWLVVATLTPVWTTGWSRSWRETANPDVPKQFSESVAGECPRHRHADHGTGGTLPSERFGPRRGGRHCRPSGTADPVAIHRLRPEEMGGGCDQCRAPGPWRWHWRRNGHSLEGKFHHADAAIADL